MLTATLAHSVGTSVIVLRCQISVTSQQDSVSLVVQQAGLAQTVNKVSLFQVNIYEVMFRLKVTRLSLSIK